MLVWKGITDSFANKLEIIDCLGFIKGIACPHFDEEKERKPFVEDMIKKDKINSCFCIEGGSALHIKNKLEYKSINFGEKKRSFKIFKENNKLISNYY